MDLQVLYADTLFLSNCMMNWLALSLTGAVMHVKIKKGKLLLSSLLGGAYALIAVLLAFPGALHIAASFLLSAVLVLIAFGEAGKRLGLFLRAFALFYFSSVLLGGGIEALFALMEGAFGTRTDLILRPADLTLVLGFLSYFILRALSRFLSGGALPHSVSVRIVYGDRSVTLPLLVDSGCHLSDPMTGRGAILVSHQALQNVLPRDILRSAQDKRITMPNEHWLARRCRLLPMVGAGGERLLLAFRPDEVRLISDGGTLDVWVALYTADTARFDGCFGLFPASFLYGRSGEKGRSHTTGKSKKGGVRS